MKNLLLPVFIYCLPCAVIAQAIQGDSILAAERSIDRPVTLHARQIRVTGSYELSFIRRQFDASGETIRLRDQDRATTRHRFLLDMRYGFTDFVQATIVAGYSSKVVRERAMYAFHAEPDPAVSQDVTRQYSGLEDVYVGFDFRAPLRTRKLDIAVTLGATLPVAPYEPRLPEHSVETLDENGIDVYQFVYRYRYPAGKGVVVTNLGAIVKYRSASWAVSARIDYRHGLEAGKNYEWRHQLKDGTFEYRQDPFDFRLADANYYSLEWEYQPVRWLDLFAVFSGHTAFGGWTSPDGNTKVSAPYETSWLASPGVEILATPKFWLRQQFNFPVAGKNFEAPFSFRTTLMYNFFVGQ